MLTGSNEKETAKVLSPDKAAAAAKKEKRKQSRAKVSRFFVDVKSELKKITWPEFKTARNKTIMVIIAIILSGVVIYGFDKLMLFLVGLAVSKA